MALSGPSGRHKRVMSHENNGQVPYKRPRLTTDVGYESQTTLCFRPHSIISTSGKFPGKHILSSVHGEGVENILSDILSTNTGAEMPHITPKYLLAHSYLGDITETISKNFENLNLKKFEHLIKEKRMATTKEKYKKMDSRDLLDLLMMSPFCKNINYVKDEVQENNNCTETEYGNTSKGTVFLVLSKALNSLVPQSVWGSQENYNRMEFFMWQLLDMGVRDTISIGVLLDGMQLKDVRWVKDLPPQETVYIVSKFFVWIVEKLIVVTLRSVFYQTQMSGGAYQIFYFPKNKTESLLQKTINSICEVMPSDSEVKGVLIKVLPKKSGGVRPLFREETRHRQSQEILEARLLLKYLVYIEQQTLASVSFSNVWQNALYVLGKESKLYFVKTDIKNAFSSVDVRHLLVQLHQACKNMNTLQFMKYSNGKKEVNIPLDEYGNLLFRPKYSLKRGILTINVQKILGVIEASLQPCVAYKKLKIKLAKGLPQGCCLSRDLCDFYLARMTSLHLDDLTADAEGVIIRVADDFLFLSKSLEKAQKFKFRMTAGFEKFNCWINSKKTLSNINCEIDKIYFNGYIICMITNTILINVSDLAKVPPRYSMTFTAAGNMKSFISNKLFIIVRNRLQKHMMVPSSADPDILLENVWRVGIHCGAKLYALVRHACYTSGVYNSSLYARTVLNVSKGIFKRIRNFTHDFLGENIFISILVCSTFLSFSTMSKSRFGLLKNKLKDIVIKHLTKITEEKEQKLKDDLLALL